MKKNVSNTNPSKPDDLEVPESTFEGAKQNSFAAQYKKGVIPIYVEGCALFFQCFSLEAA